MVPETEAASSGERTNSEIIKFLSKLSESRAHQDAFGNGYQGTASDEIPAQWISDWRRVTASSTGTVPLQSSGNGGPLNQTDDQPARGPSALPRVRTRKELDHGTVL
jgi:hypothetical protein